jgi:O-antigen/teichoic acid export membrane protein
MIARPAAPPAVESTLGPALRLISGRAVGFAATFAIPVILARLLDQADFGTYKQLFLIAGTLYGIGQLGMAESLLYFLPRAPGDGARYVANAGLALALGGAACLAGLWLGRDAIAGWLGNPAIAAHAGALGLYMALMLGSAAFEIVMIARKRYGLASRAYAALDVLRALCFVVPALLAPDLSWLLLGAVVFAAVRAATAIAYMRREFGPGLAIDGGLFRGQLAYAMPFQLAGVVEIAQANLHQYVVAAHVAPAAFAVYAVGCLQVPLVELVNTSVVNVMMVRMSEELRDGRAGAALAIWHDSARKLALLFFPLVALLLAAAHPIIAMLFTERYAASVPVFMVSSLALLLTPLAVDSVLRVHADTRFLVLMNGLRLLVTIALIGWLMASFGLVGAMAATVIASAVAKAAGVIRIGRLMRVPMAELLPWRGLAAILAAAALAGVPALAAAASLEAAPLAALAAAASVYGAAYLGLVWVLGALGAEERAAIRGRLAGWRVAAAPRVDAAPGEVND